MDWPQRSFAQLPVEPAATAFVAVAAAALATVVSGVNVFLGALLLMTFLLDQVSGMLKSIVLAPPGVKWFDRRKVAEGAARKGLILIGVLSAGVLDMLPLHIEAWRELSADITPITKFALAYAIIGQLGSIFTNVSIVKEARLLTAFMLRRLDTARLGHEPPARRSYDPAALALEQTLETTTGETFHDAAQRRDEERGAT